MELSQAGHRELLAQGQSDRRERACIRSWRLALELLLGLVFHIVKQPDVRQSLGAGGRIRFAGVVEFSPAMRETRNPDDMAPGLAAIDAVVAAKGVGL